MTIRARHGVSTRFVGFFLFPYQEIFKAQGRAVVIAVVLRSWVKIVEILLVTFLISHRSIKVAEDMKLIFSNPCAIELHLASDAMERKTCRTVAFDVMQIDSE